MIEGTFNKILCDRIRSECGLFTYKTSDRFRAGVPDIYVPGGIWIESKIFRMSKSVNWLKKISPQQAYFMDQVHSHMDFCLVAARFEMPDRLCRGVIVPYKFLYRHDTWTPDDAAKYDMWYRLPTILGPKLPRNIDMSWYKRMGGE